MRYDVRAFGARGDGGALDHWAIQKAIDCCHRGGGGTVEIPAGRYLCGTIRLRSNVCLCLEAGATILAAEDPTLFHEIARTPFGNHPGRIQALLWADDAENVTVSGQGTVDGRKDGPLAVSGSEPLRFRPVIAFYRNCRNVKFLDVTFRNADMWTLHLMRCDGVMVRGVSILNCIDRINSDGIDPDGCRNVTISDCHIVAGDDCIVIKSTEGDVCENITVSNCVLSTKCAALKIGTEAIGDIRNITFSNCVIHDTRVALALYMKDGSTYENMIFSNMTIEADGQFPILVDVTPRYYKEPKKGRIRNVQFENVNITSPGRCLVEGLPDAPIENLSFRNVTWNVSGACKTDATKPGGTRRQERDPEAPNYAEKPYHFVAAHVEGLEVSGLKMIDRREDSTPDRGLFYLRGVKSGRLESAWPFRTPIETPPVRTEECERVDVRLPE